VSPEKVEGMFLFQGTAPREQSPQPLAATGQSPTYWDGDVVSPLIKNGKESVAEEREGDDMSDSIERREVVGVA